ncbi:MAG TPA: hypothetical protein VGB79_12890 [Allosphingosinicella sp.]|jgi:hypothetical protein
MPRQIGFAILGGLAGLALSACATTARMQTQQEITAVTRTCGLPLGHVSQFEEEPRLVFLMIVERPEQLVCVRRWARREHLRLVYIEAEGEVIP